MTSSIGRFGSYLLGVALLASPAVVGSPVSAADSKGPERSAETEASQGPKDAKKAKESQEAEEAKADESKPEKAEAQEAKAAEAEKPAAPARPATHTVKKGRFKIEVSLDGVFEAQKMTEVAVRPEAWSSFEVVSAVEHGATVQRRELLVSLDREEIDRAIADLRRAHQASEVALKLAEQQLATLEKTTPMDLAANQRTRKQAHEDLDYYFQVSRPLAVRFADFSLRWAQEQFEYQEEELRQLEKMYEADDLTEETEEIILKRARNALDRVRFYLEEAKIFHERTVKVTIPRRDVSIREATKRIDLLANQAKVTLPLNLKKQRMDLEKVKLERTRSEERLNKLLADRKAMTVKAPVGGVVYYGKCVRGKFSGSTGGGLKPGATLSPNQTLMTIVKPRPMFIRTSVAEKELHNVRAGIKGTATPTGYPDLKLTAIVQRVAAVPTGSGSFDTRITVALDDKADALMPGMTCKVELVAYLKKDALTVPPKCLVTDEVDEQKHYVYVLDKKGKSKRRSVTVGRRTAQKVEILKGLSEGDAVVLEPPKDKEPAEKKKPPKEERPPKEKKATNEKKAPNEKK